MMFQVHFILDLVLDKIQVKQLLPIQRLKQKTRLHMKLSQKPSNSDYGNEVGVTNFAKVNGIITKGTGNQNF